MLKAPLWADRIGAVPTVRGWEHPVTGELLISRKHSDRQVQEWYGLNEVPSTPVMIKEPTFEEVQPEVLVEVGDEIISEVINFDAMTKSDLIDYALEKHGVELKASSTKAILIEELNALVG